MMEGRLKAIQAKIEAKNPVPENKGHDQSGHKNKQKHGGRCNRPCDQDNSKGNH